MLCITLISLCLHSCVTTCRVNKGVGRRRLIGHYTWAGEQHCRERAAQMYKPKPLQLSLIRRKPKAEKPMAYDNRARERQRPERGTNQTDFCKIRLLIDLRKIQRDKKGGTRGSCVEPFCAELPSVAPCFRKSVARALKHRPRAHNRQSDTQQQMHALTSHHIEDP